MVKYDHMYFSTHDNYVYSRFSLPSLYLLMYQRLDDDDDDDGHIMVWTEGLCPPIRDDERL